MDHTDDNYLFDSTYDHDVPMSDEEFYAGLPDDFEFFLRDGDNSHDGDVILSHEDMVAIIEARKAAKGSKE